MPVEQVSVFLDNHPGSLSEVMAHLDRSRIRFFALSIADAGEYGLVRMVTENPEKVFSVQTAELATQYARRIFNLQRYFSR
jgi:hypothetical protein